ncbi:hypothetical protein FO440_20425 [Mucilaginibacter corticis]|uniref:Redoxin domain-containing protein n=1 Tax=Mucilaginibacter corticis TaxID=2597670 RepID=A0A556MG69_9SPHI|nr:hypothetical protein [Mucilaginibacter corticis]TSJ38870.1 hypothetical protein FO440_20425 [Mucilaginibacter corticis]
MKKFITAALLLSCSASFAQNGTTTTQRTIKGSDLIKMMPKVTDPKVYDMAGNVIDSVKAKQMLKTFDYNLGMAQPVGQTEFKHVLIKANHALDARIDKETRVRCRPKSPKLWEGTVLDLKPFAKHTDLNKLQGKALVLLFRARQYPLMYPKINDVIANYISNNKFEVFAINNLSYEDAMAAQKADPVLNAHNIIDAQDITDFYETNNEAVIVVTNAQHQITYAVTGEVAVTPWVLNGLLKAL